MLNSRISFKSLLNMISMNLHSWKDLSKAFLFKCSFSSKASPVRSLLRQRQPTNSPLCSPADERKPHRMYFHLDILNNTEHVSDGEARPAAGPEGKEGLSCHRNARPSAQKERCEVLNGCLKMDLNMALHTLSWAAALRYLHVTKATRARTTQGQSGFP